MQSKEVTRTKSLVQGSPEAPKLFNLIFDEELTKFHAKCMKNNWGVSIGGKEKLCILCFADHFWILATSARMLQEMTTAFYDTLVKNGWKVPLDECVWCSTCPNAVQHKVVVNAIEIERRKREEGFKVLGTWITFDNSANLEIDKRVSAAWAAFAKHRDILTFGTA